MNSEGGIVTVGGGRGFVVAADHVPVIVTAAHCLPSFPPPMTISYTAERTYANLVGPVGGEPSLWVECLFVDPIADVAVLGAPDGQELFEEASAYEAFVFGLPAISIASPAQGSIEAAMLTLDGRWVTRMFEARGWGLWLRDGSDIIKGGMSGSPIVTERGAVGIVVTSKGPHPQPSISLPARLGLIPI